MPTNVTMLQTRRGEGGAIWSAGSTYTASDDFAAQLITANLATGQLPAVPQSALSPADGIAVKALVSRDGIAADVYGPQNWQAPTLAAGITSADAAYRISGGRVEFRGTLTGTITTGMLLCTLPPGLTTPSPAVAPCVSSTGLLAVSVVAAALSASAQASITASGEVRAGTVSGSPTWVSLDGLAAPLQLQPVQTNPTPTLPVVRVNVSGQTIPAPALDTYITGTIEVDPNGSSYPALPVQACEVSGHGNSTWAAPKKPLKLRLPSGKAAVVLGMPASRHWRALANYYDETQTRSAFALDLMSRVYSPWTPRYVFAELYVDGQYQGVFQITESVRADANRLPVTLAPSSGTGLAATGAYMLEIDERLTTNGFRTAINNVPITWDDPDPPTASQITYIQTHINAFEAVLQGAGWLDPVTGYARYIDMQSWADWYILCELISNTDSSFFSSCKIYKQRDSEAAVGKLHMGPLWDADLSIGLTWDATRGTGRDWINSPFEYQTRWAVWYRRIIQDPAFQAVLAQRWPLFEAALYGADGAINTALRHNGRIAAAALNDASRWGRPYDGKARWATAQRWLQRRLAWFAPRIVQPIVRNLATNPRPTAALTSWGNFGGSGGGVISLTREAGSPVGGGTCARATWTTASTFGGGIHYTVPAADPGPVTILVALRASKATTILVQAGWQTAASGALTATFTQVVLPANTLVWARFVTVAPPTTGRCVVTMFAAATGWAVNDWEECHAIMMTPGAWPDLQYTDPALESLRWSWDGTAFASTSRGWPM